MNMNDKELMNELENGVVFFDFDGVLSKYQTMPDRVMMYPEDHWVEYCIRNKNVFRFGGPNKTMQELIGHLDSKFIYVLSAASTTFEQNEKIKFIEEYYPKFKKDHIIFVSDSKYKKTVIRAIKDMTYHNMYLSEMIMVEDSDKVIADIEQHSEITCKHISSFM